MSNIKDVAQKAGVSIATVSRILNQKGKAAPKTRDAVLQAAQELGYSANRMAASLRSKRSNVIGVLLARQGSPFGATLHTAVEAELASRGYLAMVCSTQSSQNREREYIRTLLEMQVGGVIIRPGESLHKTARHTALLHQAGIPTIFVETVPAHKSADCVISDSFAGGYDAVCHLHAYGHRDIGILLKPQMRRFNAGNPGTIRLKGALQAAVDLGIADRIVESADAPGIRFDYGFTATTALLQRAPQITALFATTDMMGAGAIAAIRQAGLRVPEDMSVLAYDGLPFSQMTFPPMASMSQSVEVMGRKAVALLIDRLQQPALKPRQIVLRPQLIARASLGAAPVLESTSNA